MYFAVLKHDELGTMYCCPGWRPYRMTKKDLQEECSSGRTAIWLAHLDICDMTAVEHAWLRNMTAKERLTLAFYFARGASPASRTLLFTEEPASNVTLLVQKPSTHNFLRSVPLRRTLNGQIWNAYQGARTLGLCLCNVQKT